MGNDLSNACGELLLKKNGDWQKTNFSLFPNNP